MHIKTTTLLDVFDSTSLWRMSSDAGCLHYCNLKIDVYAANLLVKGESTVCLCKKGKFALSRNFGRFLGGYN